MANIVISRGGDLVTGIAIPHSRPAAANCSNCERPREIGIKRREILVASTWARGPLAEVLLKPRDQLSSLPNYHNMQNAQKLKFNDASDIDVASLFTSRDAQPCNGPPLEARVTIPAFSDDFGGRRGEVVIEGIKVRREKALWFDVFMREEEKSEYYCGSFIHVPPPPPKKLSRGNKAEKQRRRERGMKSCSLRLGIGHVIGGERERSSVMVRLVPRLKMEGEDISVQTIRIQYS